MKNKTVENMVITQFNIPEETEVRGECLSSNGNSYDFEAEWFTDHGDFRHQSNFTLPHIEMQSQDLSQ